MLSFVLKNPDDVKLMIGKQGKSFRKFALTVGISQSFLSQVLNEHRKPSAETAKKIAEGLNLNIDDVFFIYIDNKSNTEERECAREVIS